nr:hypothetical protein KPHV_60240 [Kitasatospora purpeofusca]
MSDFENPVARRAAARLGERYGAAMARSVVELLDAEHMLAAPPARVGGPFPVSVQRTGIGSARLDVSPLVAALIGVLVEMVAEDPDGMVYELSELHEASGPERDALMERLIDRLGGADMSLPGQSARRLAQALLAAVGPGFPHQRDGRAA